MDTVWIIAGIVLGVILLLMLLLLLPLGATLVYSGGRELTLVLRVFGIPVYKRDIAEPKKPKKPKKPKSAEEKRPAARQKETLGETVERVLSLLKSALSAAKPLLSGCWVTRFRMTVVCAGEDAADVAMSYGTACSALYPFVGYLKTLVKVKESGLDVRVGCDFEGEQTRVSLQVSVSVLLWVILRSGLQFVRTLQDES